MEESILISVIVIAYNSQEYILDALESIRKQSYKNIELIVSDDGSLDDTLKIVEDWLYKNGQRFCNSKIIRSEQNTGITANCNRGVLASSGKFVKLIAADDILLENCLEDMLEFTIRENLMLSFSRAMPFSETQDSEFIAAKIKDDETNYNYFFNKDQQEQYKALLKLTIPMTLVIGGFYRRELIDKVGYFDENYEMMEDYPFLIKAIAQGQRFRLLDKYTVKYRVRPIDDMKAFKSSKRYTAHYNNLRSFRKNEVIPMMIKQKMFFSMIYLKLLMVFLQLEYEDKYKLILVLARYGRGLKQSLINIKQRLLS